MFVSRKILHRTKFGEQEPLYFASNECNLRYKISLGTALVCLTPGWYIT